MGKHGDSEYIQGGVTLIAEAEFYNFAPAPCSWLICCNSKYQQGRTYFRVWDNRFESNYPFAPFMCLTCSEVCVTDIVTTSYFDRQPHRSGMCCFCIPCTCCGPPVLFNSHPKCCFVDCSDCCGQSIMAAPHICCGLKQYCICGKPCYFSAALPLVQGIKNGDVFLQQFKAAVDTYAMKHRLPVEQMAIFTVVNDDAMSLTGGREAKVLSEK